MDHQIHLKESEVAQSCPTLCDPVDCSPPGFSVHGILQARILEWVAFSFSRRSSQPRDWTQVSYIAGIRFNLWATREATDKPENLTNYRFPGLNLELSSLRLWTHVYISVSPINNSQWFLSLAALGWGANVGHTRNSTLIPFQGSGLEHGALLCFC